MWDCSRSAGQCTLAFVSTKAARDRYARLRQTCVARGLRLTPQRDVLLRALSGTMGHPTADDLVQKVRKVLPTVSHATVYRNVQELVRAGLIGSPAETNGRGLREVGCVAGLGPGLQDARSGGQA